MLIIKKKICVCDEVFKYLNDDLINVFVRKFKSNRHESSEAKVKSLRVVHEVSFKLIQLSCDLDFFINYNFLNIRLKCLRNDWLDVTSINRVFSSKKPFIF